MVFFDEKRPRFNGLSNFPLAEGEYIVWPEKNSPGYFVALDRDGDKKITKAYELFGNAGLKESYDNGFESLKVFDSNQDKQIDNKDEIFNKLVLWNDSNGNGKGEVEEQIPLHSKIKTISLKYEKSDVSLAKGAEEMEKSTFVFVNDKGENQVGYIADVWFTPIPSHRIQVVSTKGETIKPAVALQVQGQGGKPAVVPMAQVQPMKIKESFGMKLRRWMKMN